MSHEVEPRDPAALNPSKEAISEMSFSAAMRRAIEDLFTDQAIGEKMQALPPNDVIETLVETWKQGLATRLQTEAQATVENISAILDLLQSNEPLSTVEPMEWLRAERSYAPFSVATVCREELRDLIPNEDVAGLSDDDMGRIAVQMGDALRHTAVYWQSLEAAAKSVLNERQAQPGQLPESEAPAPLPEDATQ